MVKSQWLKNKMPESDILGHHRTMRHKQPMACASVRHLVYAHQQPTRINRSPDWVA
jgi:hypothetical protein